MIKRSRRGKLTLKGRRILVVEDEMLLAMMLEDYLVDLGCEIVGPASRIEKAMELAAAEPLDAALLDANIAGQSVADVAAILSDRGVPFIFVTGYRAGSFLSAYSDRPTLQKPFLCSSLDNALSALLQPRS